MDQSNEKSATLAGETGARPPRQRRLVGAAAGVRRRKGASPTSRQTEAARLYAEGLPVAQIAVRLDVNRSSVFLWTHAPWWARAVELEGQRLALEAEVVARRARPAALRLLSTIVERAQTPNGGVDPADAVKAAGALLAASAPPSERQRDQARRDVLGALPPALRRSVAEALVGADAESLRALSDDELARLAEGA